MTDYKKLTKTFEGFRDKPYKDTKGIPTVGYGFNISSGGVPQDVARGIRKMTRPEADKIFDAKYLEAENRAAEFAGPQYDSLPIEKKAVLNDMSYNLGNKLFKFEKMRQAIREQRLNDVPSEMMDSSWYGQVGDRSKALIKMWGTA